MQIRQLAPAPLKRAGRLAVGALRDLLGSGVKCPACAWRGARFADDLWHEGTMCPQCQSDTRHRLLLASFQHLPEYSPRGLLAGKDILHVAPESQVSQYLRGLARRYVTADLNRADVDLNLDLTRMDSVADESFDVAVACDVLEHVEDDAAALREFRRILRSGGTAIFTVPQKDHAATTYEDPSITSPEERERAFGQWDHLRIYGDDFVDRVRAAGFRVRAVDENDFDDSLVRRMVLKPPRLSADPLATNYRKVFFCQK
ncbi:MAG TPA: class I SAM-dependent methyltransferase [Pyrinomonadaceae bacterium]|nr:class I SAM-dependent methyltransferase [Pyrinomonadaceae bacterium]